MMIVFVVLGIVALLVLAVTIVWCVEIVRPTEVRLVERLGKYVRTLDQGFNLILPYIENTISINMTEQMVDIKPQTLITKDKLNVIVDAIVYYKITNPQNAAYNVEDFEAQLVSLSQTTLRAVIGKMTLTEANEQRDKINEDIEKILDKETASYGVDVLRVEIQKLEPPQDVIASMNNVIKAEQAKIAAKETALALEIKADGERLAMIKNAEGQSKHVELLAEADKKAAIARAEGVAKAIELENTATEKYFVNNAQKFKLIETAVLTFRNSSKLIVSPGTNVIQLLSDALKTDGDLFKVANTTKEIK